MELLQLRCFYESEQNIYLIWYNEKKAKGVLL